MTSEGSGKTSKCRDGLLPERPGSRPAHSRRSWTWLSPVRVAMARAEQCAQRERLALHLEVGLEFVRNGLLVLDSRVPPRQGPASSCALSAGLPDAADVEPAVLLNLSSKRAPARLPSCIQKGYKLPPTIPFAIRLKRAYSHGRFLPIPILALSWPSGCCTRSIPPIIGISLEGRPPSVTPKNSPARVAIPRFKEVRLLGRPISSRRCIAIPESPSRYFNTECPVEQAEHYCIDPLARVNLAEILALIARKKYFVLHAPRQTGKTSIWLALQDRAQRQRANTAACTWISREGKRLSEDTGRAMQALLGRLSF